MGIYYLTNNQKILNTVVTLILVKIQKKNGEKMFSLF